MNTFNFQITQDDIQQFQNQNPEQKSAGSKYISAPSAHVCSVSCEFFSSPNKGTPGLRFVFTSTEGAVTETDAKWLTENTTAYTKEWLMQTANKFGLLNELQSKLSTPVSSQQELADKISEVFANKQWACAFKGLEMLKADGGTFVKPELSFVNSADNIEEVRKKVEEYVTTKGGWVKRLETQSTVDTFSANENDPFSNGQVLTAADADDIFG